ncbi:PREDICTED: olfactory receptor 8D1-like [Gekko japonicus]|uniref:Olfactory receptor n=1 Tax=Gekko japonicus TaxID=146911 RepID=A0ABM1JME7_GEKJA|nr:PREDICTED: olfactory receptor 8D1-like [Gekko japonicus]
MKFSINEINSSAVRGLLRITHTLISSGGAIFEVSSETSMGVKNQTQVVEFVFLGFSGIPNSHIYLFLPFLTIYLVTVLGNLMIFTLIQLDSSLQSPMYYFLSHLSFLDICISSTTVPKILVNFLYQRQTITYNQCLAQMFFLMSFVVTEAALLTIMAYDRYAAICKPLHYFRLMNTKVCTILAFATWVWGFLDSLLHTVLSSKLQFCGVNQINHIFCDIPPLMKISCNDVHINKTATHIASFFVGVVPFLFTILSYIFILSSILKIRSTTGKRKAFSTCASHLTVVIIYFGNGVLNYNRPSAGYSLEIDTLVSTMYCIITPMLNPLIYSLRNKEVKGALKKVLDSQRKVYMGSYKQ